MEWTSAQTQELERFLTNFTNPDPFVQAHNLEQLEALSAHPHALVAVLSIVCQTSPSAAATSSPSVRLSAITVARHLLRCCTDVSFYLTSQVSGVAGEQLVQSMAQRLMALALPPMDASAHFLSPALRRATSSLLANFIDALTRSPPCFTAATAVWSELIMSMLHRLSADPSQSHEVLCSAAYPCAALLREMCEVPLAQSHALRDWVGGSGSHTSSLCSVLQHELILLQSVVHSVLGGTVSSATYAVAAQHALVEQCAGWMEEVLEAFTSCLDSGALPLITADALDMDRSVCEGEDGPAIYALSVTSAAVLEIHRAVSSMLLHQVLSPFREKEIDSTSTAVPSSVSTQHLQSALHVRASLLAVGMRYMAETIPLHAFGIVNGQFQAAVGPALANICHTAAAAQLTYDGAGEPNSVHAAVVACVHYSAQLVHLEYFLGLTPSVTATRADRLSDGVRAVVTTHVRYLFHTLVGAAVLPRSAVEELREDTCHIVDSAADMLVRSVVGRRHGQPAPLKVRKYSHDSACASAGIDNKGAGNRNSPLDEVEDEPLYMADMVESTLPDNGNLRQTVILCAASLTCHEGCMAVLPALLLSQGGLANLVTHADTCTLEATLFVMTEVLDSILTDQLYSAHSSLDGRELARWSQMTLDLLSSLSSNTATEPQIAPCFVRVQAVRFLARLGTGLLESWRGLMGNGKHLEARARALADTTHKVFQPLNGLEGLLWTLARLLQLECNKAVQVECVRAAGDLLSTALRSLEVFLRISGQQGGSLGTSDLEEESLDSNSDVDNGALLGAGPMGDKAASSAYTAAACRSLFHESIGLSVNLAALLQTVGLLYQCFPRLQWSVRQPFYHLLSEVVPLLWQVTQKQREVQPSLIGTTCTASVADATLLTTAHVQVQATATLALEVLAGHYTSLLTMALPTHREDILQELASVLSCMADVVAAMDATALGPVLPWVLQVVHHVLDGYSTHLRCVGVAEGNGSSAIPSSASATGVGMTDMCMVSLDLISCLCDGFLDRDTMFQQQLCRPSPEEEATVHAKVQTLSAALLRALSVNHDSTNRGSGGEALPNRCLDLLRVCQAQPSHPSRCAVPLRTAKSQASTVDSLQMTRVRAEDAFGEVRRACFAILYDCLFLLAYPRSLFHLDAAATAVPSAGVAVGTAISDALGVQLFDLCLREVAPEEVLQSLSLSSAEPTEMWAAASTENAAASDAWLCLGELLTLWDQQYWTAAVQSCLRRNRNSSGGDISLPSLTDAQEQGPASLLTESTLASSPSRLLALLEVLFRLLSDKSFQPVSYLKLNLSSAVCGLAELVLTTAPCTTCEASLNILSNLLTVMSSDHVRAYAADAASGDADGFHEAAQGLWCVARAWQATVPHLSQDQLRRLLRKHGKDVAKTAGWLLQCVAAATGRSTELSPGPYVCALLRLWGGVAQTLGRAVQEQLLFLSVAQSSALRQLSQFSPTEA